MSEIIDIGSYRHNKTTILLRKAVEICESAPNKSVCVPTFTDRDFILFQFRGLSSGLEIDELNGTVTFPNGSKIKVIGKV